MKVVLIVGAIVLIVAVVFGVMYLVRVTAYQNTVKNLVIDPPALESVADGTYTGSFDADIIGATVSVTVEGGAIARVDLVEHKTDRGTPAEGIVDEMVAQQRIDVDAVSGATNSSKVIQKAAENALRQN